MVVVETMEEVITEVEEVVVLVAEEEEEDQGMEEVEVITDDKTFDDCAIRGSDYKLCKKQRYR